MNLFQKSFLFVFQSYVLLALVIFIPYISQSVKWIWTKAIGSKYHTELELLILDGERDV